MYHQQMMFQPGANAREMTVTGNGEIVAQPDYAQVQIEVRTQGKDVSAIQRENAVIMNRVIDSLMALKIPKESIQTTAYNIFPNYDFIDGKQVLRGYEVQNAITVKIDDIGQVGTAIDTAIQNGANHVSAIEFKITDTDVYYRQALQFALIDAVGKATAMAKTMGVTLHMVPVEIIEEQTIAPIPYKAMQLSSQRVVTPIEPGTMTVSASVRVKFSY
ncbi:SIMPL domain-containing protein [Solibacillus sp. FSL R5-0449]|uniref:SIMPL domain-containing protein n=1 Tax=Solibacillus sp. FSL R5-0449 TaxID=2921639 RepID=UPI0030CD6CB9